MAGFTTIDAASLGSAEAYRLMTGSVVPRPIAWITTVSATGLVNAAPFSSYNYVAHTPPTLAVNIATRDGVLKDTARNILETRAFVVNVPTEDTLEIMHATSADHPPGVSETDLLGIKLIPSQAIAPPRIAAAPIQFECRLTAAIPLGPGVNTLYIGEITVIHLSDAVFDGRRIDIEKLRPVMRLAGPYYGTLGRIIHLPPLFRGPAGGDGGSGGP